LFASLLKWVKGFDGSENGNAFDFAAGCSETKSLYTRNTISKKTEDDKSKTKETAVEMG